MKNEMSINGNNNWSRECTTLETKTESNVYLILKGV